MCGIFGYFSSTTVDKSSVSFLANHARQRGRDSSGLVFQQGPDTIVQRADYDIKQLLQTCNWDNSSFLVAHSRLITNGLSDNQPVCRQDIAVFHNGIIVNEEEVWSELKSERMYQVDSEAILGVALDCQSRGIPLEDIPSEVFQKCKGVISAAIIFFKLGKIVLLSNNGSLYCGYIGGDFCFSSEEFPLVKIGCEEVFQLKSESYIYRIPVCKKVEFNDDKSRNENLVPALQYNSKEEALLLNQKTELTRCKKCILPETMPFIQFYADGECNYCKNYKKRNNPKPKEELFSLIDRYRRDSGSECVVPFSGGRDSCWALHIIVNELQLRPITYTYDWGMVTDLGRRNISRMCADLGVENIIVAADISKKRSNIRKNLQAWLRSPHLGMVSILTAGDKHFFRHIETIKKQTGISLNLWGVNPLEVTHFKAGFLGVKPDFYGTHVYRNGAAKQLNYQFLRLIAMSKSLGYFNASLWDTISGEYYRSFTKKTDYFHIYDYWQWDERVCDDTLKMYDWELAPDTNTTWRIGDGTAAFYNYIYQTMAGFTEHDTFRSNQIREGQITRQRALELVEDENRPRYQNIRWYLDAVGLDFREVISRVNEFQLNVQ